MRAGPIQITNNDLKIVSEPTFEVFQIGYYKENVNYAIMVGSPYQIIPTTLFQVLYTHDGGITWNTSQLDPPGLSGTNNVFKGVYMVSLLNSVIVSSFSTGGYILYSTDSGVSYQQITGINQDFQSVFVNSSNQSFVVFYMPSFSTLPLPNPPKEYIYSCIIFICIHLIHSVLCSLSLTQNL